MNEAQMRAKRALQALKAIDQHNMGRAAGGMGATATDRLADLDACTHAYRTWSPSVIPGLLQTDDYTATAIATRTPSLGVDEVEKRVLHRTRRTESFLGRRAGMAGTYAWFVIGEAAIARPITSLDGHAQQLRHVLDIARDYDNLVIQVLRESPPQPGLDEPFSIFALDPGPVVGHLESLIGGWYTVAATDVARLHSAFADLSMWALAPTDSQGYISEVLDTCWEHISEQSSSSPRIATPKTASTSPVLPPAPSE